MNKKLKDEIIEVFYSTDINRESNISFRTFLIANYYSSCLKKSFPELWAYYGFTEDMD